MMLNLDWSLEDSPSDADIEHLVVGVTQHGRTYAQSDARPLASFVRSEGEIVGGISGRVEFNRLFISYLWVQESLRGQGIGTTLLQQLESAGVRRGCNNALIETLLDDVYRLYLRQGYVAIAIIPNYVGTFSRYILLKQLSDRV